MCLEDVAAASFPAESLVILAIEIDKPILSTMTSKELECIRVITNSASRILWLMSAGTFEAQQPQFSLVSGLSRTLMMEQPALGFWVFDIGQDTSDPSILAHVCFILIQDKDDANRDFEYVQHAGALYISRFVPCDVMNTYFRQQQNSEARAQSLREAGRCRLSIGQIGSLDTIHFVESWRSDNEIPPNYVEVELKAAGINAKVDNSYTVSR